MRVPLRERWKHLARQRRGPFGFEFWIERGYCPCLSHLKVGALVHAGPRRNRADKKRMGGMYWLPVVGPWQLYVRKFDLTGPRLRFRGGWKASGD